MLRIVVKNNTEMLMLQTNLAPTLIVICIVTAPFWAELLRSAVLVLPPSTTGTAHISRLPVPIVMPFVGVLDFENTVHIYSLLEFPSRVNVALRFCTVNSIVLFRKLPIMQELLEIQARASQWP